MTPPHTDAAPIPATGVDWVLGPWRMRVLDLGSVASATSLLDAGHEVLAAGDGAERPGTIDSGWWMTASLPQLPLPAASVDAVVCSRGWGPVDGQHALAEIARVLRPGGTLATVTRRVDTVVPWVRRFLEAVGTTDPTAAAEDAGRLLEGSDLFGDVEAKTYRSWETLDRAGVRGLARTSAGELDAQRMSEVEEAADRVYAEAARPPEPVRMPWVTLIHRARVSALANYHRDLGH